MVNPSTVDGGVGMPSSCTVSQLTLDAPCLTFCGDCDGSGTQPDISDALRTAQIGAGLIAPTPEQLTCCDVDGDLGICVLDALLIASSASGVATTLTCP